MPRVFNESELTARRAGGAGFRMDQVPDRRPPSIWILLEGRQPWSMADHALAFVGQRPCPVCHNSGLRKVRYCLGCDATGLDGKVEFPGLKVDEAPDPEWSAEPTVYDPDPNLAGGTEKPAPVSTGIKRSRVRRAG